MTPELVRKCQLLARICVIGAEQVRSLVPPPKTSPPPVVSSDPHIIEARIQGPPNALAPNSRPAPGAHRRSSPWCRRRSADPGWRRRSTTVRERALRLYLRACCSGFRSTECKQARSWDCRPHMASPCRPKGRGRTGPTCRVAGLCVMSTSGRPVSLSMLVKTFCGTKACDRRYAMLPSVSRLSQYR